MVALYIIVAVILLILLGLLILSQFSFDDNDPDQFWYDNYNVLNCPHHNTFMYASNTAVTCETMVTECADCGKVINVEVEC